MDPDLERYHRQVLLPGIGEDGQRRLLAGSALIAGCGALGTVVANLLARAGVGRLVLVDRDVIEITNLQRQVLFDEGDVEAGLPKAEAARRKLEAANSGVTIEAVVADLDHRNAGRLAAGCGVIVDGLDNFETRYLLNDLAVARGIPYVYAGAVGTVGALLTVLPHTEAGDTPWEEAGAAGPCLRCMFEDAPPPGQAPTCDTAGVLASTVSLVASLEVNEAIKILTGNWQAVNRSMVHVDTWTNQFLQLDVGKARESGDCPCCRRREYDFLEGRQASTTTTLCGRDAIQLRQPLPDGTSVDLESIARRLGETAEVRVNAFLLRATVVDAGTPYELTVFADGRTLVKGTDRPDVARSVHAKYVGG